MNRRSVSSGTPWERVVGYSRAVRVGPFILISGTTATDQSGEIVGVGDPYAQMVQAIRNIQTALERLGGTLGDVVRTRIYVTNVAQWEDIGRAHGEFFQVIRPAATMVEVRRLIDPRMLVEVEVDAIVDDASTDR